MCSANSLGARILGANAEEYRPHVTLAMLADFCVGEISLADDQVKSSFAGSPGLTQLGVHGTVPKILKT